MAGSCGAFCAFCGKCGREIPKAMLEHKPKNVPPPGVALDSKEGSERVSEGEPSETTNSHGKS